VRLFGVFQTSGANSVDKTICFAAVIAAILCFGPEHTACCAEGTSTELPPIGNLLPADGTEVDVMGYPERFMELSRKLQAGIKENPGAFASGVLNAKPGEPVDYDPRLGMTEEEYREFLELAKEIKFVKLGSVTLKVGRSDEGVKLDGGEFLPELSKITFNLMEKQVRTPFGNCTKVTAVCTGEGQKATSR
jgi:hypothetical protein